MDLKLPKCSEIPLSLVDLIDVKCPAACRVGQINYTFKYEHENVFLVILMFLKLKNTEVYTLSWPKGFLKSRKKRKSESEGKKNKTV